MRTKILDFIGELQQKEFWCWAATVSSVSNFYNKNRKVSQEEIAINILSDRLRSYDTELKKFNRPQSLEKSLKVCGFDVKKSCGPISFNKITERIDKGDLLCAKFVWDRTISHYVTIYGYEINNTTKSVYIFDPKYNQVYSEYNALFNNYLNNGSWMHTYYIENKI